MIILGCFGGTTILGNPHMSWFGMIMTICYDMIPFIGFSGWTGSPWPKTNNREGAPCSQDLPRKDLPSELCGKKNFLLSMNYWLFHKDFQEMGYNDIINPITKKQGSIYIISFPYPTATCFFQETSPFPTKGTHCPEQHSPNGPNRKGVVPDHNPDIKRRVVALALQGRESVDVNCLTKYKLVGGFNPFEKYQSNWIISLGRGENKKYLKPPSK